VIIVREHVRAYCGKGEPQNWYFQFYTNNEGWSEYKVLQDDQSADVLFTPYSSLLEDLNALRLDGSDTV
jgi:hypothetical protein